MACFFGLVIVCAVFFSLGYTLGRKSDALISPAPSAGPSVSPANGSKPGTTATAQPMTFYKAVEQTDANPQLTPAAENVTAQSAPSSAQTAEGTSASSEAAKAAPTADPMLPSASSGYFVQVAAVSKQEDAAALVDALKKKQYPAFVASNSADKLFRVQVGPYVDIKEAEAMRLRLVNDGYNPILKK